MRGRFTANAGEMNGASAACCPAFNHNNIKRLRAEIKLVSVRDFLRFSFAWQHVAQTRITGRKAFDAVWPSKRASKRRPQPGENEILNTRLADYDPDWLDERCLAGYFTLMRLRPRCGAGERRASPVRSTPISILLCKMSAIWASLSPETNGLRPTLRAATVADQTRQDGASFSHDLLGDTGLRSHRRAVGLLVADSRRIADLADAFARATAHARRRRRSTVAAIEEAGLVAGAPKCRRIQ